MFSIPPEINFDILCRLQPKDLIRFMCVSKGCYAFISNQRFIKAHLQRSIESNSAGTIIVGSRFDGSTTTKFFSLPFNNDNKITLGTAVEIVQPFKDPEEVSIILGYSVNGLVCIRNRYEGDIALWNPSIQKYKKIPFTTFEPQPSSNSMSSHQYGFGYDSANDDYKLVDFCVPRCILFFNKGKNLVANKEDDFVFKEEDDLVSNEEDDFVVHEEDDLVSNEEDDFVVHEEDDFVAIKEDVFVFNEKDDLVANEEDDFVANEEDDFVVNEEDDYVFNEDDDSVHEDDVSVIPQVSVYSLKCKSWKMIPNLPYKGFQQISGAMVFLNGALNWMMGNDDWTQYIILTLDLTTEKFQEFSTPVCDASKPTECLGVLGGSLCICVNHFKTQYDVWIMKEYGETDSWTLLYSIEQEPAPPTIHFCQPLILSNTGEMVLLRQDDQEHDWLCWHDIEKKSVKPVAIHDLPYEFKATICVGSLCLLDGDPVVIERQPQTPSTGKFQALKHFSIVDNETEDDKNYGAK